MIRFEGAAKTYLQGDRPVRALDAVDLTVGAGEFLVVMGPSGSGKSTLLHLAGGIDLPSEGRVLVDGRDTANLDDDGLTQLRRDTVGFVFQFFNLLPTLTVEENVALPAMLPGPRLRDVAPRVGELIARVGLEHRLAHRPSELSGGEMQRVAIARALIGDPPILLVDEPTGNLDSDTGAEVLELLRALGKDSEHPRTIVMVTHDQRAADWGDRLIEIRDGRVVGAPEPNGT